MKSFSIPQSPLVLLSVAAKAKGVSLQTMKNWIGQKVLGLRQSRIWFIFVDKNFQLARKYKRKDPQEKKRLAEEQKKINRQQRSFAAGPFFFQEQEEERRQSAFEEREETKRKRTELEEEAERLCQSARKRLEEFERMQAERKRKEQEEEAFGKWLSQMIEDLSMRSTPKDFFAFWCKLFPPGAPSPEMVPHFVYQSAVEDRNLWEQRFFQLLTRKLEEREAQNSSARDTSPPPRFFLEGEAEEKGGEK